MQLCIMVVVGIVWKIKFNKIFPVASEFEFSIIFGKIMSMQSAATTVNEYLSELPDDRKAAMTKLHKAFKKHLPKGFVETMSYGMITYCVPHKLYPNGYHCNPKQPLPFMSIASQKQFIAVYHMGIYANPVLLQWFTDAYAKHSTSKLDMGKSCMRFKKMEQIPFDLLSELASKMTVEDWITCYENAFVKNKK